MESVQDLRLTWVNYSQKLTEAFNKFLSRESLCNVTLSVNRRSIKAHQAILSACSPWFEDVLMENQHPHPIIILKDVRYEDLRNIIKFIYTGEVSVPQHDLQDFLRTAELLEIKGLLRSSNAPDDCGAPTSPPVAPFPAALLAAQPQHTAAAAAAAAALQQQQQQQQQQQHIANSIIPNPAAAATTAVPLILGAAPITDGIDLVSQIKVPVSIPGHTLQQQPQPQPQQPQPSFDPPPAPPQQQQQQQTTPEQQTAVNRNKRRRQPGTVIPPAKRRNGLPNNGVMEANNTAANNLPTSPVPPSAILPTNSVGSILEEPNQNNTNNNGEEDGHWGEQQQNLTPAQMVANGVNDCGAFKRIWAERYLCYNLGREIICLLCFCRFTQFKKFNLERHMRNKHPQLYNLTESTRKLILSRYVSRYESVVTPGMVAAVPAHGNAHMASEILAVGPIQLDDLQDLPVEEQQCQVVAKTEEEEADELVEAMNNEIKPPVDPSPDDDAQVDGDESDHHRHHHQVLELQQDPNLAEAREEREEEEEDRQEERSRQEGGGQRVTDGVARSSVDSDDVISPPNAISQTAAAQEGLIVDCHLEEHDKEEDEEPRRDEQEDPLKEGDGKAFAL